MYALTYPWGSYNHIKGKISDVSPDNEAFDDAAKFMLQMSKSTWIADSNNSGSNKLDPKVRGKFILDYTVGNMNEIVYPVSGSFEDWAYAASWENYGNDKDQVVNTHCNGISDKESSVDP